MGRHSVGSLADQAIVVSAPIEHLITFAFDVATAHNDVAMQVNLGGVVSAHDVPFKGCTQRMCRVLLSQSCL